MKILDALDNVVTEYDRNLYYLVVEKRVVEKKDATPATKDKFHFETELDEHGKRRLKVVIDEKGENARPAFTITEAFFRLTPFTEAQLADPQMMEAMRHPYENAEKFDWSKLRRIGPRI